MKSSIVSITVSALALSACATSSMQGTQHPVAVPDALRSAPNEKLVLISPARGVQIYECKAAADGKLGWAFVAPEAELFDVQGKLIGKHYVGPTWELADGSKTVGTVKQRADAPIAGAIPWLLLSAKSAGGAGQLASISSLQRVTTVAGVAPAEPCAAGNLGTKARVPYTADYYFYAAS
jgi:hypothetical protein